MNKSLYKTLLNLGLPIIVVLKILSVYYEIIPAVVLKREYREVFECLKMLNLSFCGSNDFDIIVYDNKYTNTIGSCGNKSTYNIMKELIPDLQNFNMFNICANMYYVYINGKRYNVYNEIFNNGQCSAHKRNFRILEDKINEVEGIEEKFNVYVGILYRKYLVDNSNYSKIIELLPLVLEDLRNLNELELVEVLEAYPNNVYNNIKKLQKAYSKINF